MGNSIKSIISNLLKSLEQGALQAFCLDFLPIYNAKYIGLERHGATAADITRKGTPDLIKTGDNGNQIAIQASIEKGYWTFTQDNVGKSKPQKDINRCIDELNNLVEIVLISNQEIPTNNANAKADLIKENALTNVRILLLSISNLEEEIASNIAKYFNILKKYLDTENVNYLEKYLKNQVTIEEILEIKKKDFEEVFLKKRPFMDLRLESLKYKAIEKKEHNNINESEIITTWESFKLEGLFIKQNDFLLINPSGMGKTTFLKYLGLKLLSNFDRYKLIPINITCQELYENSDIVNSIINNEYSLMCKADWSNIVILMDGLDQTHDASTIARKIDSYEVRNRNFKKAKLIISSRENTAQQIPSNFTRIRLKLPDKTQIIDYLGSKKKYEKLKKFFFICDLLKTPILLEMVKSIIDHGEFQKIDNRTDLYKLFTEILIKEEENKLNKIRNVHNKNELVRRFIPNISDYLEKISFLSLLNHSILKIPYAYFEKFFDENESNKIDTILNLGIILEIFERDNQSYVFRHQSFQEFFAAKYLKKNPKLFNKIISNINVFNNDVWKEVIKFYVGLSENETDADCIIYNIIQSQEYDDLLRTRLLFSIDCLLEHKTTRHLEDEIFNELFEAFIGHDYLQQYICKKMELLKYHPAKEKLLNKFRKYSFWFYCEEFPKMLLVIGNYNDIDSIFSDDTYFYSLYQLSEYFESMDIEDITRIIDYLIMSIVEGESNFFTDHWTTEEDERIEAIGILYKWGNDSHLAILKKLLLKKDTPQIIKIELLQAIVNINYNCGKIILKTLLNSSKKGDVNTAISAICELEDKSLLKIIPKDLLKKYPEIKKKITDNIKKIIKNDRTDSSDKVMSLYTKSKLKPKPPYNEKITIKQLETLVIQDRNPDDDVDRASIARSLYNEYRLKALKIDLLDILPKTAKV